jgi:hypothetical protein
LKEAAVEVKITRSTLTPETQGKAAHVPLLFIWFVHGKTRREVTLMILICSQSNSVNVFVV